MYLIEGRWAAAHVPNDVYNWPAHRKEIQDKVQELNAMIESIVTGKTQSWPGLEKVGDLYVF